MLFARAEKGGETAAILTTIIKTAADGLYPDEYIIKILRNQNETIIDSEKFLPWNPWMRDNIEIKR